MPEIFGAALMGGGSGPAYAAIGVTYPAGATCTCALGSKTFTAPDTSGQALFIVPTAGQWVVTISQSGQQPVSQTISVTESKAYVITLVFDLILYDAGDQRVEVTGGWQALQGVTFNADSIKLTMSPGNYYATVTTNNPIDITSFSILRVYFTTTGELAVGLNSSKPTSWSNAITTAKVYSKTPPYADVNVNEISGKYYPVAQSSEGVVNISQVILIK